MSSLRRLLLNNHKNYEILEYIEGTGTQYIELDYRIKYNSIIDCEFAYTQLPNKSFAIFGYRETLTSEGNVYWVGKPTSLNYVFARLGLGNDGTSNVSLELDKFNRYQIKEDHFLYVDGVKLGDNYAVNPNIKLGNTGIFNLITPDPEATLTPTPGKLRYFRIIEDNTVVVDLIPVLDSNGRACLYDKISNKFYYNSGSEEFKYKKWDKIDVDYIETSGELYLDTNYKPNQNTSFKIKYSVLEYNTESLASCPYGVCGNITVTDIDNGIQRTLRGGNIFNRVGWGKGEGSNKDIRGYDKLNTVYEDFYDRNIVYINNNLVATLPDTEAWQSGQTLIICGRHKLDGTMNFIPNKMNIYGYSIIENGIVISEVIPCVNIEGNPCFYDKILNKLLLFQGSGNKTAYIVHNSTLYQVGKYIESSGPQVVALSLSGEARWIITAQANEAQGTPNIVITSSNGQIGTWFGESTNTKCWGIGTTPNPVNIPVTEKVTADLNFTNRLLSGTIDGIEVSRIPSTTHKNWTMFNEMYPFKGKVFSAKAYRNNILVMNLIPTKRVSDNKVSFFDTVSKSFQPCFGTTDLILGV